MIVGVGPDEVEDIRKELELGCGTYTSEENLKAQFTLLFNFKE